jgi:hypothetical protein
MGLQLAARADAVRITRALQNWPNEYGMSIILTVPKCFVFKPAKGYVKFPQKSITLLSILSGDFGTGESGVFGGGSFKARSI